MSESTREEPRIRVNGEDYLGWTEVRITRGLDRMAADFDLSVYERWSGLTEPWQITPFSPVEIFLGGDKVLTGYVDGYFPSFEARGHSVRIIGRSKTEDLIDCTPEIPGGEFRATTLDAIARAVCAPFGIEVVVQTDMGDPFDLVAFERTETGHAFLERLGRLRGVLLTDDAEGRLVLTRAGTDMAAGRIEQGQNILAATGELNMSKRFSKYIIKAQSSIGSAHSTSVYTDEAQPAGGGVQTGVLGTAVDSNVPRYRPHVSLAEKALTQAEAQERAQWQAAYAAGRAIKARITLQGWRQPDGTLWVVNQQVPVLSAFLKLDMPLLIASVSYGLDLVKGRTTVLELGPVSGFTPDPGQVKRRTRPGTGGAWMGPGDVVPVS